MFSSSVLKKREACCFKEEETIPSPAVEDGQLHEAGSGAYAFPQRNMMLAQGVQDFWQTLGERKVKLDFK